MQSRDYIINTINVFVIETELQYLSYTAIRKIQADDFDPIIFTTSENVYKRLCSDGLSGDFVSRNSSGWLGRLLRLRKNLALYKKRIVEKSSNFSQINFHVPRIDNIHNNIAINFFKHHFPHAKVNVRLIPDGAINIFSAELSASKLKKQKRWISNVGFKLFSDLSYYPYSGDELGADSESVDRIYCFNGINTGYQKSKIVFINLPISVSPMLQEGSSILVIGQDFLRLGIVTESYIEEVSSEIYRLVKSFSSDNVDYAPHPRSTDNEFGNEEYTVIDGDYLCVEEVIAKGNYKHVVSCSSTALINSKIMLGDDINTYAVGLDSFPFPDPSQGERLTTEYRNLGVKLIGLQRSASESL
jgi:hypothetical protein